MAVDEEWEDNSISEHGYHSTDLFLPDGRVLLAAGEYWETDRTWDYEIFKPPYLLTGNPRPTINNILPSSSFHYFNDDPQEYTVTFTLTGGATVQKVVLMKPCSITHHSDFDQRYVKLNITSSSFNSVKFHAPATRALAPPGYYMLFLVTNQGTPSVAKWVHLR